MERIYLDNGATTLVDPAVRAAMLPWLGERVGNPSSVHCLGVEADRALREARQEIAAVVGTGAKNVLFTSGGTESNALAVLGTARRRRGRPGHIICSAIEHPSVLETCRALQAEEGWSLTEVPVDGQGLVSPDDVAAALRPETALVSIMLANNVIGTVQPLREIVREVRAHRDDVPIHTDAVQALLKETCDLRRLGVSLMTLSSHKIHGPQGSGALVTATGVHLVPLWRGGAQENERRAGTQNVPGVVGFGAAVAQGRERWPEDAARMAELRDRLIAGVLAEVPGSRLNGSREHRLPNNAHLSLPGVNSEPLLHAMDAHGVIASAGSACHAAQHSLSHVLRAIGYRDGELWGHVRLTLSRMTTAEEIDAAVGRIGEAYREAARGTVRRL